MGNTIGYQYDELVADKREKLHELDANHCFQFIQGRSHPDFPNDTSMEIVGIIEYHRTPTGEACGGFVNFRSDGKHPVWKVESMNPLTISPSVLCKGGWGSCVGDHGFIRNGRWVPA